MNNLGLTMGLNSTIIYTSKLILCSTISMAVGLGDASKYYGCRSSFSWLIHSLVASLLGHKTMIKIVLVDILDLRSAHTMGLAPATSRRGQSHRVNWPFLLQNLVAGTNFSPLVPATSPTNSNQFKFVGLVSGTKFWSLRLDFVAEMASLHEATCCRD